MIRAWVQCPTWKKKSGGRKEGRKDKTLGQVRPSGRNSATSKDGELPRTPRALYPFKWSEKGSSRHAFCLPKQLSWKVGPRAASREAGSRTDGERQHVPHRQETAPGTGF